MGVEFKHFVSVMPVIPFGIFQLLFRRNAAIEPFLGQFQIACIVLVHTAVLLLSQLKWGYPYMGAEFFLKKMGSLKCAGIGVLLHYDINDKY